MMRVFLFLEIIRSIEGNPPSSLFLKKNGNLFWEWEKIILKLSECGASGTITENDNQGEVSSNFNQILVDDYLSDAQYNDL